MATDIFHESRKTIPRSDPRVSRVPLDKEDIGARKSHLSGLAPKNSNSISHVGGK